MTGPDGMVTLANRALARIGQAPTFSLDSADQRAAKIHMAWQDCLDRCFSLHDWSWARRTTKLPRRSECPTNGWCHGFDLPGDRIGDPLKVLACPRDPSLPLRDFDIEGGVLYADVCDVWVRVRVAVDPVTWEPGFRSAFVVAFAGFLAVPLQQDADLEAQLFGVAFGTPSRDQTGGLFGRLIAQNRAGSPLGSPLLRSDPLTDARFSS